MKIDTSSGKINSVLERGVIVDILPSKEEFKKLLASGKRLKIYIGIDPTSVSLHLSHGKNFMLLEEFRSLGHEVFIVIGDFTARIGDPSGRTSSRKPLSKEEIKKNTASIIKQIRPLLGFGDKKNPPKIVYNSTWLAKLSFGDILELASNFTVQQMLERDMFARRIKDKNPIYLHEFFYPLMQGYDSVALDIDAEMGGTDQIFNILAGRTLLKRIKNKEKFAIVVNLMESPKTGELMSKSKGVGVFLDSSSEKMFGEVMAQPDEMIEVLLINSTRIALKDVRTLVRQARAGGKKARDVKMRVAEEIVASYYSKKEARKASRAFDATFSKGELPKKIKTKTYPKSFDVLLNIVTWSGLVDSKSEARRLIADGAVEINNEVKRDPEKKIKIEGNIVLKVGKHRFLKIIK